MALSFNLCAHVCAQMCGFQCPPTHTSVYMCVCPSALCVPVDELDRIKGNDKFNGFHRQHC